MWDSVDETSRDPAFNNTLPGLRKLAKCTTEGLDLSEERWRRLCTALTFGMDTYDNKVSYEQLSLVHDSLTYLVVNRTTDLESPFSIFSAQRWFCSTHKDRFAWIPKTAQADDKIFLIRGACIPFVLRPQPCGSYKLVGECYIEGFMEGEALELPGFEWQDLRLI